MTKALIINTVFVPGIGDLSLTEAVAVLTDQSIAEGRYTQQTVKDLRDAAKALLDHDFDAVEETENARSDRPDSTG